MMKITTAIFITTILLASCKSTDETRPTGSELEFEKFYSKVEKALEEEFLKVALPSFFLENRNIELRDLYLDFLIDQNGILHLREDALTYHLRDKPSLMDMLVQAFSNYNEDPIVPPDGYLKEGDYLTYRLDIRAD